MSTSYAETAAEIAAVSNDVDRVAELIEESDRLLETLECLNRDGRKTLTDAAREWTADLSDRVLGYPLPVKHEARHLTQAALDHVFDEVQPSLLRWHLKALGIDLQALLGELEKDTEP